MKKLLVLGAIVIIILACMSIIVVAGDIDNPSGDTSEFYVNVLKPASDIISISVNESFNFGNVEKGKQSSEYEFFINNTGNVAIRVTPKLMDTSEEIFSYLYMRDQKTSGGEAVPFAKIGDFSLDIAKPTTGGSRTGDFYMILNLTNYNESITSDVIGHKTDVKFVAVKQ